MKHPAGIPFKRAACAALLSTLTLLLCTVAYSATQLWSTDGFVNPESALYDSTRDIVYISNVNGAPTDKDGVGHISKMSLS